MLLKRVSFDEVNNLQSGGDLRQGNNMGKIVFPHKMTVHLNILVELLEGWIVINLDRTLVVIVEWRGSGKLYNYIF